MSNSARFLIPLRFIRNDEEKNEQKELTMNQKEIKNAAGQKEILGELKYRDEEDNAPQAGVLTIEEGCLKRSQDGPWKVDRFFRMEKILLHGVEILRTGHYRIYLTEKKPDSLKGSIHFNSDGLHYDMGAFSLDAGHPVHCTGFVTVIYDMDMQLTLELVISG